MPEAPSSFEPAPGQRPLRVVEAVRVVDAVQFAAERILPVLGPYEKKESLALHPTCSSTRLGLNPALAAVAAEVAAFGAGSHASCNRTCELGMTRATGEQYQHVLELLNEVSRGD